MTDPWSSLAAHRAATEDRAIAALFQADPDRARGFSTAADGLLFDWSKTAIDADAQLGFGADERRYGSAVAMLPPCTTASR